MVAGGQSESVFKIMSNEPIILRDTPQQLLCLLPPAQIKQVPPEKAAGLAGMIEQGYVLAGVTSVKYKDLNDDRSNLENN